MPRRPSGESARPLSCMRTGEVDVLRGGYGTAAGGVAGSCSVLGGDPTCTCTPCPSDEHQHGMSSIGEYVRMLIDYAKLSWNPLAPCALWHTGAADIHPL